MAALIFFVILFIIIFIFIKYRIEIDILSFLKKGFQARRGKFGVYCFTGKQGSGKTFSTVNFILQNQKYPIYSNIHLKGIKYKYFSGFDQLLKIDDHHCIIVFDEIFTALTKGTKMDTKVLSFLSQMRKRNIIFITTAQEWLEINITLRRYVRYQIDCVIFNLLPFSILIEYFHDGEQMKWSNEANDYIAPIVSTKIRKMALDVARHYDSWERIDPKESVPISDSFEPFSPELCTPRDAAPGVQSSSKTEPERAQSQPDSSEGF